MGSAQAICRMPLPSGSAWWKRVKDVRSISCFGLQVPLNTLNGSENAAKDGHSFSSLLSGQWPGLSTERR